MECEVIYKVRRKALKKREAKYILSYGRHISTAWNHCAHIIANFAEKTMTKKLKYLKHNKLNHKLNFSISQVESNKQTLIKIVSLLLLLLLTFVLANFSH